MDKQLREALSWANSLCSQAHQAAKQEKDFSRLQTIMKNAALKTYYEGKFSSKGRVTDEIFATVNPRAAAVIAALHAEYKRPKGQRVTLAEIRQAPPPVTDDAGLSYVKTPDQVQQWLEQRSAATALLRKVGNLDNLADGDLDMLKQELLDMLKQMQLDRLKSASVQLTPAELAQVLKKIEGEQDKRADAIQYQREPAIEAAPPRFTEDGHKIKRQYMTDEGLIVLYEDE